MSKKDFRATLLFVIAALQILGYFLLHRTVLLAAGATFLVIGLIVKFKKDKK